MYSLDTLALKILMQPICGHVLLSSDISTRANATDQHVNTLLILKNEVLVSHYSGVGTTGTLGAGALGAGTLGAGALEAGALEAGTLGAGIPMRIVISRVCPYTTCSFFTPTSIALSCSARTDVLSSLQELFHGKYIIENSDVSQ